MQPQAVPGALRILCTHLAGRNDRSAIYPQHATVRALQANIGCCAGVPVAIAQYVVIRLGLDHVREPLQGLPVAAGGAGHGPRGLIAFRKIRVNAVPWQRGRRNLQDEGLAIRERVFQPIERIQNVSLVTEVKFVDANKIAGIFHERGFAITPSKF
jgi:hypothetical protein